MQQAEPYADHSEQPRKHVNPFELASFVVGEMGRRIYRRHRSRTKLTERLASLQQRLACLPRSGVGMRTGDLDCALDLRLVADRLPDRELVIGDFDQDGGIVSRVGVIQGIPTIRADHFLPRTGCAVALVDLNGRLGVRKTFAQSLAPFVQEIEAMLALEEQGCAVPRLMNVDWAQRSITMTFVPGDVVRELLANAGADIRDRDGSGGYSRAIDRQRIRSGRTFVPKVLQRWQIARAAAGLKAIHDAGYVLEDVKFGNIILHAGTGEPVFVDLERALPTGGLPEWLAEHLRQVDWRKFHEHFGKWHREPHSR